MKKKFTSIRIQVLDANYQGIDDAVVTMQSREGTIYLNCVDQKGNYISEQNVPKGDYTLVVSKKPFEEEKRKLEYKGSEHLELFILLKKGTPFYYRGKVKTPFTPLENTIGVLFKEQPEEKEKKDRDNIINTIIKKYDLKLQKCGDNISDNGIYVADFAKKSNEKQKIEICEKIDKEKNVITAPVLRLTENNATLLTNEIMVKFEDYVEKEEVEKIAAKFNLKIKRKISVLGNLFHFTTGKSATYEVLDISNKIAENEEVIFSEPNLIHTVEYDAITPTAFLFPEQWDHQILNTPDAWQFLRNINTNRTFGDSNVIIAVVDSGVDTNHPEFSGNVSDGNSKIYRAFDFSNMVANNNSLSSDHGTCCASAAAALVNNLSAVAGVNEGVAGVAGNCRVLAIRGGGDEARYADMYLWAAGFDPESDTVGFPAQISPGADIITNSFGFSVGSPISGTMSAVFDRLTDDGRNGRGTLLFFSAGNINTDLDIDFNRPWGMYNRCFSVAASTLANDGVSENKAAYSSFGSVIEFCAPSHDRYVNGRPLHNPPNNYGAFTATRVGNPNGRDVAVGRPTVQNSLSANANSGNNTITVNNIAGFNVGQAIMINNPGSGIAESHSITAINNAARQITLDGNLFNNQPNGTNVFAAQADYRNNFGGTSHATPLCAGVAALMLSANPQLTWIQVRDLMRVTAVKINPGETNANGRWQDINGNFSNEPNYDGNPVFSEFYGFGRIDAAAAVEAAGWRLSLIVADNGYYGNVCVGSFKDMVLTLSNSGVNTIPITGLSSSFGEFIVPNVLEYPLTIEPGNTLQVPIRFQPASFGMKQATITVESDPFESRSIEVSGISQAPELDLITVNGGAFGDVCIGSSGVQPLSLLNSGPCPLRVTNISSSSGEFLVATVQDFPIQIAPRTSVQIPIRFAPSSFGRKLGVITVTSNDPNGPKNISVSGNAPSGRLVVTGSTCIGGVKPGCLGERTIAICNVGDCKLDVSSVALKRPSKYWKLINNPFPATLHPGSCLSVLIRYKASEKCPKASELVITSDDPNTPEIALDLMAYTDWTSTGYKGNCDPCDNESCKKQHCSKCSVQSLDSCCEDEGDYTEG